MHIISATLFIHEVDDFLESLTFLTREDEQMNALSSMAEKCTVNDLTIIIRLIKAGRFLLPFLKHFLTNSEY